MVYLLAMLLFFGACQEEDWGGQSMGGAYGRATPTPTLAHCGYSIKDILLCRFSYLRGLQQLTEMAYESCQSGVKRELDGVIAHLVGWKLDANTSCTVFRSRTIGL